MRSGIVRRRVHHEDVGGSKYERLHSNSDDLSEPLLANDIDDSYHVIRPASVVYDDYGDHDNDDDDWKDRKRHEEQAWTQIFSRLIAQWAQWIYDTAVSLQRYVHSLFIRSHANLPVIIARLAKILKMSVYTLVAPCATMVTGLGAWFRRTETCEKAINIILTPLQEERLQKLQQRLEVPFDGTRAEHRAALMDLWQAAFPNREIKGLVTEQWKEMGWQGNDPSTDFRGGGFISLENLLFFAHKFPKSFQRLLYKEEGKRAVWEYPFAVAGINISFMLIQMLDLRSAKPSSRSGVNFLKIMAEEEMAFDMLYCIAFELMDAQWLAMRASYMEFNAVLQATRAQLERELCLEDVTRVQDLPAYNLLCN